MPKLPNKFDLGEAVPASVYKFRYRTPRSQAAESTQAVAGMVERTGRAQNAAMQQVAGSLQTLGKEALNYSVEQQVRAEREAKKAHDKAQSNANYLLSHQVKDAASEARLKLDEEFRGVNAGNIDAYDKEENRFERWKKQYNPIWKKVDGANISGNQKQRYDSWARDSYRKYREDDIKRTLGRRKEINLAARDKASETHAETAKLDLDQAIKDQNIDIDNDKLLTPKQAAAEKESRRKDRVIDHVFNSPNPYIIADALHGDDIEGIPEALKNLDPKERAAYLSIANGRIRRLEQKGADLATEARQGVVQNGIIDPKTKAELGFIAENTDNDDLKKHIYGTFGFEAEARKSKEGLTIADRKRQLSKDRMAAQKKGGGQIGKEDLAAFAGRESAIKADQEMIKNTPVEMMQQRSGNEYQTNVLDFQGDAGELALNFSERVANMKHFSEKNGVDPKYLTKQEASELAEAYLKGDRETIEKFANAIKDPDVVASIATQVMGDAGKEFSFVLGSTIANPNSKVMYHVLDAKKIPKENRVLDDKEKSVAERREYILGKTEGLGMDPGHQDAFMSMHRDIAESLIRRGHGTEFKDVKDKALEILLNGKEKGRGGIEDARDGAWIGFAAKIIGDPEIASGKTTEVLSKVDERDWGDPEDGPHYIDDDGVTRPAGTHAMKHGYARNAGNGGFIMFEDSKRQNYYVYGDKAKAGKPRKPWKVPWQKAKERLRLHPKSGEWF